MSLGRKKLKCVRPGGAYDDVTGIWAEGTETPFYISASVQPLSPREMLLLPENRRQAVTYRLYTDYQLRTADPVTQVNADRVTILDKDGAARVFEVISVAEWSNGILPHCKAIVSLMQNLPDGAP